MRATPLPAGVRLIVAYKVLKALAEVALVAGLLLLARDGGEALLRSLAELARHHLASRWSALASHWLGALSGGRGLRLVELGLGLDAALTAL